MTIETKFHPGQTLYFLEKNAIQVEQCTRVSTESGLWGAGSKLTHYAHCHFTVDRRDFKLSEDVVFASKADLLASL